MKSKLKLKTFFIVVILVSVAKSDCLFAQDRVKKIDELIMHFYKNKQFNGTALVAEGGQIIFHKAYGMANMEWNVPNKLDTKFRIGSITKQFVSMLIMQLVSEGKIKLDGKLTQYIPEYRKDTGNKITIHHLLTHTSGIPTYTGYQGFWRDLSRNHYDIDYMIKHFHSRDLEFEPGTDYKYNNTGYYLLAVIVERVTGKSFEENLKQRILIPLKMKNSGIDKNHIILKNRASGYIKQITGFINDPYFYMPNAMGAGNMYSTVRDLFLWDQALYTEKLISKKYRKIMFTPFLKDYAYGWGVRNIPLGKSDESLKVISHTGGINGFNTIIFRIIRDRRLIVLFNNTGRTRLFDMSKIIMNILYNKPYELPKKPISDVLASLILEKGIKIATEKYRDLKTNHFPDYDFGEPQLNTLGYQLLEIKKVKEAISIFKLNVEAYPKSSNPYDSLGEAYMINGDKELAIKNYAKSLEINPKNTNAIIMLKKIVETKSNTPYP